MTYSITWDPGVIGIASRFLADDPAGLAQVLDAVDQLADDPRPQGSVPYGTEDLRRMHTGRYRVLYEIAPQTTTITVIHLGRTARPGRRYPRS